MQNLHTHMNKKHSTYIQCHYQDYLGCRVEETQKKEKLLRQHAFIFVLEEPFILKVLSPSPPPPTTQQTTDKTL